MNLKKFLSGFLAAAVAATTLAVTSMVTIAEDSTTLLSSSVEVISDTQVAEVYTFVDELSDYENFAITYTYNNADAVAEANNGNQWKFSQTFALKTQETTNWKGNYTGIDIGVNGYASTIENGSTHTVKIATSDIIEHARAITGWDDSYKLKIFLTAYNIGDNHIVNKIELVDPVAVDEPTDEPTDPAEEGTVLYEGSTEVGSWSGNVTITAEAAAAAITNTGKLVVTIADTAEGAQYGFRDLSWNNINDYSDGMSAGTTSFEFAVTAGNLTAFQGGFILTGRDFTIKKIVFIADEAEEDTREPADDPTEEPADEPVTSDYALLSDEALKVTTKYEGYQIPVTAVAGDKITVTFELNDAGEYHQLSFKHAGEGWPALTSPKYTNEWNCVDVSESGTFTFTLNAEDAANITANKLIVSGYAVTYTKVELNADKKPAAPGYTGGSISAGTLVKQTTPVVDGKYNARFVTVVSENDLEDATKIVFTLYDGVETVTAESTKCYCALTVNGSKSSPDDGYVYLCYTVRDIPDYIEVTCSGVEIV